MQIFKKSTKYVLHCSMHLAASFIVPPRISPGPDSFRWWSCCSSFDFSSLCIFFNFSVVLLCWLTNSSISSSNIFLWFINVSSYSSLDLSNSNLIKMFWFSLPDFLLSIFDIVYNCFQITNISPKFINDVAKISDMLSIFCCF